MTNNRFTPENIGQSRILTLHPKGESSKINFDQCFQGWNDLFEVSTAEFRIRDAFFGRRKPSCWFDGGHGEIAENALLWPAFVWKIPAALAGKGRLLTVRVMTSMLPVFGDPKASGAKWKRGFYQPPRTAETNPGLLSVSLRPPSSI